MAKSPDYRPPALDAARSPNIYESLLTALRGLYGEPAYELLLPGPPRGFTVARKTEGSPTAMRSRLWAREAQAMLDHEYSEFFVSATKDSPLFFFTQAWFGSGRHCDPENTHKLLKDALFRHGEGLKDKYTARAFAGPLYDLLQPRTEVYIWRLSMPEAEKVSSPPAPATLVRPPTAADVPRQTVTAKPIKSNNPFDMLK